MTHDDINEKISDFVNGALLAKECGFDAIEIASLFDMDGVQALDNSIIAVAVVNDAPSFTKGADQTVLEDAGAQTVPGWATAISVFASSWC